MSWLFSVRAADRLILRAISVGLLLVILAIVPGIFLAPRAFPN